MFRARDGLFVLVWLLLLVTRQSSWAADTPLPVVLSSDTALATEGYFVLRWSASLASDTLELVQHPATDVDSVSDSTLRAEQLPESGAITITGLRDGSYTYRLLANGTPASNPVTVTVQHHALPRAFGFFALGGLLFSILVVTIFLGNARAGHGHAR